MLSVSGINSNVNQASFGALQFDGKFSRIEKEVISQQTNPSVIKALENKDVDKNVDVVVQRNGNQFTMHGSNDEDASKSIINIYDPVTVTKALDKILEVTV